MVYPLATYYMLALLDINVKVAYCVKHDSTFSVFCWPFSQVIVLYGNYGGKSY
jgi:predicted LPLAT superfamily acyltransferase